MPYNPQVQDISGQILAQGMRAQSQGIASGIGAGIQNFMKMEEERRKTTGAIQGMLADPYFQQELAKNPTLSAAASKIQSGKANLNDVQQFLGSLTSMQYGRKQQMDDQRLKMEQETLKMQQENAITNRAYVQGQLDAIKRKEREAQQRSEAMSRIFGMTAEEKELPADTEGYIEGVMGAEAAGAPVTRRRPLTAAEGMRAFAGTGATIDEETVRTFGMMAGEEAARGREAIEREKLVTRATDAERRLQLAEAKMGMSRDPVIAYYQDMVSQNRMPQEQADKLIEERVKALNALKLSTEDKLNMLSGGAGGTGGVAAPGARSTTRPGGTTGTPAVNRFR
jgi:hypothetical protein